MIELFKKLIDAIGFIFAFITGKNMEKIILENNNLHALEAAQEAYDKKEAEIKMQSQINLAYLQKHGLADVVSTTDVLLHVENGKAQNLRSANLLDVRD